MLAIFVGVVALSSIFGGKFLQELFGLITKEWKDWSLICTLLAYFRVLAGTLKRKKFELAFNTSLFASVIMAFTAFSTGWGIFQTHQGNRLDATLGNASLLGHLYMVFHIFLALALFTGRKISENGFIFLLSPWNAFALYYTEHQRGELGIIGGLLIARILIAIISPNKKIKACSRLVASRDDNNCRRFLFLRTTDFINKMRFSGSFLPGFLLPRPRRNPDYHLENELARL